MNEIDDLRQELNQPSKCLNKQEDLTELKTKLQYLEKGKQYLKEENENKIKIIETVLNQNNELLKLNHEIYNKNNVTHYREKSIKECPKQDDFQVASKTSTKKIKQSLEKDMDNSNNNNRFISPNRFGRLFYEDNNNDDNESITNNTDSTKTLLNDQINKILQKIIITMIKIKTLVDRKQSLTNIQKIKRFIHVNVLSLEQILIVNH